MGAHLPPRPDRRRDRRGRGWGCGRGGVLTLDVLSRFAPRLLYDSRERVFAQGVDGEPDTIYGRIVDGWAQWWIYYERDWSPVPWRKGHAGDWEGVQIRFGLDDVPEVAAYAQHDRGEVMAFTDVLLTGEHPHVYVELGRHASHPLPFLSLNGRANGRGRVVVPRVELMPWDGFAGRSFGSDRHSPASPARQWRWRDPSRWAESL